LAPKNNIHAHAERNVRHEYYVNSNLIKGLVNYQSLNVQ